MNKHELERRLKDIKLVIIDADGVMTDGGIFLGETEDVRRFDAKDGAGIKYLKRAGIDLAIISGRVSRAIERRAQELGVEKLYQGEKDKLPVLELLLNKLNLRPSQVAYIGDDLTDLPVLRTVGLGIAVADAAPELKEQAHYVTTHNGGKGAIREVAELILNAQNKWTIILERYLGKKEAEEKVP